MADIIFPKPITKEERRVRISLANEYGKVDKEFREIKEEEVKARKEKPQKVFALQTKRTQLSVERSDLSQQLRGIQAIAKEGEVFSGSKTYVIVGPNGAGKSRLGYHLASQSNVVRIAAQKDLYFDPIIPMQPFNQSRDEALRLGRSGVERIVGNYQPLLSSLLALQRRKHQKLDRRVRTLERVPELRSGERKIAISELERQESEIEAAERIWSNLFSERKISISEERFNAYDGDGNSFPAGRMSDGERAAFYIMGHVLIADPNATILIDEPENHLHKAILDKLFDALEAERSDCTFIYITHDLEFATSRRSAVKLWVKEYFGDLDWNWIRIPDDEEFPEELLFKVMGSRKPILFVEGEKSSHDIDVYEMIYPEFTIIPVGGCGDVIRNTRSFNSQGTLHDKQVRGLIDRDYRSEEDVNKLQEEGISILEFAEVENLFLVEGIVKALASNLQLNPEDTFSKVKDKIIKRLVHTKDQQVGAKTRQDIKKALLALTLSGELITKEDMSKEYEKKCLSVDIEAIYENNRLLFDKLIEDGDYNKILKWFNEPNKRLHTTVEDVLGVARNTYYDHAKRFLRSKKAIPLIEMLKEQLPQIPVSDKNTSSTQDAEE